MTASLTLLIVEDSAIVRARLAALANGLPNLAQLRLASNGFEALGSFRECRPDAVLLDIDLPDMSGLDVLAHIKNARPACRVIMLTNYGSPEFRQRCADLGADDFFHKATEFECAFDVLREEGAGVRGAMCGVRGARCGVRGAGCEVRGGLHNSAAA